MITRIVKMVIKPEEVSSFVKHREKFTNKIRSFKGCVSHDFLKDKNVNNTFFSYSTWDSEQSIDTFRHSELFQSLKEINNRYYLKAEQAWTVENIK